MTTPLRQPSVLVIGAGMTGILAVIKLRKAGIDNITVLEKKDRIGGTWRENTYPGVACDVPSPLYTYSFEPNPDWSKLFAGGAEIQQYFENVADKYDVNKHIRFNEAATSAHYDNGQWFIRSSQQQEYRADFIINATGILHHPAFPDIPGIDAFEGNMFHTAQWNHSVPFDSTQKVGVIGTGSTAAQVIPELVDTGADVTVFQRTPQWLMPLGNFDIPEWVKSGARRFKWFQKLLINLAFKFLEHFFTKAVIGKPLQRRLLSYWCQGNLRRSISDPELREKLTPNYRVGCKRIVINKTFYDGIQKPNAHLETSAIQEITAEGVRTTDGTLHKLDTLVLSTGFNPTAFMRPMDLKGKNGLDINDAWKDDIKPYRSILLKDFPNFFLMLGPFTPIGNFSVIAMSEVQLDYIVKMVKAWQQGQYDAVEPHQAAIDDFYLHMKNGLKNTAWTAGCQSWYLDKNGVPLLWPYTWQQWVNEMKHPDWSHMQTITFGEESESVNAA